MNSPLYYVCYYHELPTIRTCLNQKNQKLKIQNFKVIDGLVSFCPNCGTKFIEPVAANYDYVCPACNQSFNIVKEPEKETEQ